MTGPAHLFLINCTILKLFCLGSVVDLIKRNELMDLLIMH